MNWNRSWIAARTAPALSHGHPFRDVREGYWSSTTSMFEPDWAWALYLVKKGTQPFSNLLSALSL